LRIKSTIGAIEEEKTIETERKPIGGEWG